MAGPHETRHGIKQRRARTEKRPTVQTLKCWIMAMKMRRERPTTRVLAEVAFLSKEEHRWLRTR